MFQQIELFHVNSQLFTIAQELHASFLSNMNDSTSKYITLLLASVSGGYVFTSL